MMVYIQAPAGIEPAMKKNYIVGMDEVGRGSLAGPVEVAAVVIPAAGRLPNRLGRLILRDSKKMTPKGRERWYRWAKEREKKFPERIRIFSSRVYPKKIDRTNISMAANEAARRLFEKINKRGGRMRIYLDGGLYLKSREYQESLFEKTRKNCRPRTIVKGDEKVPTIKLASIVAKVERDRYMAKQDGRYRGYNFSKHKGYATKDHFASVRKKGICRIHRLTFFSGENIIKDKQNRKIMPPPVKHHSKSKVGRRRAHLAKKPQQLSKCPKCGGPVLSHRACSRCGFYGNV